MHFKYHGHDLSIDTLTEIIPTGITSGGQLSAFGTTQFTLQAGTGIINKLNKLSKIDTFVKTKNGFKVTGVEGFVAIDRLEGGAVKLVDRMEFSTNNFSKDIIKGWDNPG